MKKVISAAIIAGAMLIGTTAALAGQPSNLNGVINCHRHGGNPANCPTPIHNH